MTYILKFWNVIRKLKERWPTSKPIKNLIPITLMVLRPSQTFRMIPHCTFDDKTFAVCFRDVLSDPVGTVFGWCVQPLLQRRRVLINTERQPFSESYVEKSVHKIWRLMELVILLGLLANVCVCCDWSILSICWVILLEIWIGFSKMEITLFCSTRH